jgi:hypothetical protein
MVEINLLPWREYARARKQVQYKILILTALTLLAVIFFLRHAPRQHVDKPITVAATQIEQLKKIKYVGYLHHHQRMWALVSMPDGKILDARAGSLIGNSVKVLSLNEAELILAPAGSSRVKSSSPIKILLSHS